MKLFLKRNDTDDSVSFTVYDESAHPRYNIIIATESIRQKMMMEDRAGATVSEITHSELILSYFKIRCGGKLYILIPHIKECFYFIIYGSSLRFAGNIETGSFSLYDVDKSPVMTQKKCWGKFGGGYELKIYRTEQELFGISCAICADIYMSVLSEDTVFSDMC